MQKKIVSLLLRTFVSVSLIVILLYIMKGKYGQILRALKGTHIGFFALALIVFSCAISLGSYRLKLIIEAGENIRIKFLEALSLTYIGYFFNNFLPTSIGGDVVKAYYLAKKSSDKMGSYTSVFIDRVIGLVTMIFMAAVALLFVPGKIVDERVRRMIYVITAIAVMGILFLMNKNFARKFSALLYFVRPVEEKLKNAYNAIHVYKHHTKLLVQSLAISVVSQLCFFASIGILALSIGVGIPALEILLRMPIISAMSMLPSINGLGLREGSTVLLFGPLIGRENAFAVSILWLFILFIMSVLGGLIYGLSPQFKVKLKEVSG
ncbi:MAG: lysylphosphatidylglycerol synthase transmembrane domain-containing protein [Candidatus Omnitrophica bacterium]|nr:lysylphosphatidylglycerol synthase transmembrane domain-containing protein [Candidatus Omnitrophota bacterium]